MDLVLFGCSVQVQEKHAHATPFDVPPLSVQRWMKTGTHAAKGKAICKELNDGVLTAVNAGDVLPGVGLLTS